MIRIRQLSLMSQLFMILGTFLVGSSLGWGWGLYSRGGSAPQIAAYFSSGFLSLAVGLFLQNRLGKIARESLGHALKFQAISLDDAFRAFRNYRSQPALFEFEGIQSFAFAVDGKKAFIVPPSTRWILVELWDGPELKAECAGVERVLKEREIQLLPMLQDSGQLFLDPRLSEGVNYCHGVLHFISHGQSLE